MALRSFLLQLLVIGVFACVLASQAPSAVSTADPWLLPAGTVVHLHNLTSLDSQLAEAGDLVSFEVTEPVESRGLVIIPKHAVATGRIVKVDHSHWGGKSGDLAIDIEQVQDITGAIIKVRPFIEPVRKAGQKSSVGETAGVVAAVVAFLPVMIVVGTHHLIAPGAERQIPPGSDFSAQTIYPVPLDFSKFHEWQREDPFAAAYAEVVLYRPIDNGSSKDPKNWEMECSGDHVATLGKEQYVRFFLPSGDYWLKASGKARTIAIEKKEIPKSQLVHLRPNSQYVFTFLIFSGWYGSLGRSGYVFLDGVDIGENRFSDLAAAPLSEFKPKDTPDKSKPNACGWKDGQPFAAQRGNDFAIIDGTPIELQLTQDWSSETAKVGDKVSFALSHELEVRRMPILKAGDVVDAIVSIPDFVHPEKYKGPYDLVIPNLTLPDGQRVLVRTRKTNPVFHEFKTGAPIVSAISGDYSGSPYVIKKHSVLRLAKGTVVTIYVQDNYLLDPEQAVMKAPVEGLTTK